MKTIRNVLFVLIFLALYGAFFYWYGRQYQPEPLPPIVLEPEIIYRDTGRVVEIPPAPIDSAAVVEAYYTHRPFYFEDTVQNVKIRFTGTLYENTLNTPRLMVQDLRPREVVEQMRWSGWIGGRIGPRRAEVSLAVAYQKNMFEVNYDAIGSTWSIGYKRRLF